MEMTSDIAATGFAVSSFPFPSPRLSKNAIKTINNTPKTSVRKRGTRSWRWNWTSGSKSEQFLLETFLQGAAGQDKSEGADRDHGHIAELHPSNFLPRDAFTGEHRG